MKYGGIFILGLKVRNEYVFMNCEPEECIKNYYYYHYEEMFEKN